MKLLTNQQIKEIETDAYSRGFNQGVLRTASKFWLTTPEDWIELDDFLEWIKQEIKELSFNTWDQDRINMLLVGINNKRETWRLRNEERSCR